MNWLKAAVMKRRWLKSLIYYTLIIIERLLYICFFAWELFKQWLIPTIIRFIFKICLFFHLLGINIYYFSKSWFKASVISLIYVTVLFFIPTIIDIFSPFLSAHPVAVKLSMYILLFVASTLYVKRFCLQD